MNKKEIELAKEYMSMTIEESQNYADDKCFYCEKYILNDGVGKRTCKFAPVCDKDINTLRKELK